MLAVIKEKPGEGFAIKEQDKPICREEDLLIRVKSVGICGSDLPILSGTREIPWPMIPGHEFAGDVVEVGARVAELPGVPSFKVGDRITSCLVIGCGNCKHCIEGDESLCDHLVETGIHVDGAFAEYVRVPAKTCVKLKDDTSYDLGASIDPVASAYRTVKAMRLNLNDTVMVLGPGPIGLYAVQLLKLRGVKNIICVGADVDEKRLELAKQFGANYTINGSKEDIVQRVTEITDGAMCDFVQDCAGAVPLADIAMQCLRKKGCYALTGLFHAPVPMNLGKVVRSEVDIIGTICYTREEFNECLELVESGRVQVEPLITTHYALNEMEEAFALALSKKAIKIMMHP